MTKETMIKLFNALPEGRKAIIRDTQEFFYKKGYGMDKSLECAVLEYSIRQGAGRENGGH